MNKYPELAEIAKKIKKFRELRGFNQSWVSAELNIDIKTLRDYENGTHDIGIGLLMNLAKLYDGTVQDILNFNAKNFFQNNFNNSANSKSTNIMNYIIPSESDKNLYEQKIASLLEEIEIWKSKIAKKQ